MAWCAGQGRIGQGREWEASHSGVCLIEMGSLVSPGEGLMVVEDGGVEEGGERGVGSVVVSVR